MQVIVNQKVKWFFVAVFTFLFMCGGRVQAQTAKYLVLLKDKTGTPFTTDKPTVYLSQRSVDRRMRQGIVVTSRDLPVNPSYVSQIRQTGAKVWYTSRWLNAVLVEATTAQLTVIQALPSVKGIEFNRALRTARLSAEKQTNATQQKFGMDAFNYGASLGQIQMLGADAMHNQGYNGKGMLVAILDAGFLNSNTNPALSTLFTEKRVVTTYDFVKNEASVYEDDSHGNNVFSIMASFREGSLIGPAYGASYALLRTEDNDSESRLEEANWLIAAEYADSLGVDVINTSLGYNQFNNEADNYTYADMNGKTTLITRAADWAAAVGMVVVASAGNEGSNAWKYISAPADADSILAVGAVGSTKALASFSSLGPSADGRVKPDVCAQGALTVFSNQAGTVTVGNGTSYSAPLIAGLVTAFWQSQPQLTAMQVIDCIRRAGDRFSSPTPQFGYGIPTFAAATEIARAKYLPMSTGVKPTEAIVFPNPLGNATALQIQWGLEFTGKKVEVALTDVAGRVWLQQSMVANETSSKLVLPMAMPQGGYFLKVNDNERVRVLKVIK